MSSFLEVARLHIYTCITLDGSKVGVFLLSVCWQAASISDSRVFFLVYIKAL